MSRRGRKKERAALARFEVLAEEFRRDTGMMAPGKDSREPEATTEERFAEWESWLAARICARVAAELEREERMKGEFDARLAGIAQTLAGAGWFSHGGIRWKISERGPEDWKVLRQSPFAAVDVFKVTDGCKAAQAVGFLTGGLRGVLNRG